MRRFFAIVLAVSFVTGAVSAQEFPEFTPDTPVDTATLHTWLVSLDPHLIAWAADFARRRHDTQIVSEIPPLLEQWSLPMLVGSQQERTSHRQVVLALLDTLIQENATVPLNVVECVADQFPAQALILIQRLPRESWHATLVRWTFGATDQIVDMRSRAAAMLLAESPDSEFVSRIVRKAEQNLTVQVVSKAGTGFGGGIGSGCGDGFGQEREAGWPPTFAYVLREYDSASEAPAGYPIAQIGSDSITAERMDSNHGAGDCSTNRQESGFRHELIAYWLGLEPADMPWKPEESRTIVWTNKEAYERELGAATEEQRTRMLDTFASLQERGLLDAIPEPRIVVEVQCGVDPCPLNQVQRESPQ